MSIFDPTASDIEIGKLADLVELGRPLPAALLGRAAARLGVSARTVRRYVDRESRRRRDDLPELRAATRALSDRELEAYLACNGNAAAAWRDLAKQGEPTRSMRTLQRAVAALPAGDRGFVKAGIDGRRGNSLWLRHEAPYRNHTWEADAWEIPVWVIPRRGHRWIKVWAIFYLDCFTRALMGHVVDVRHQQAHVLAAFKRAILPDDDFGPFCGIPDIVRTDHGTEFTADETTTWHTYVGCYAAPAPPNFPQGKGKIERFLHTLEQEWASTLPFYTGGPRREDGKLYGPNTDPLTVKQLAHELDLYLQHYNTQRAHSALNGQTPAQCWQADPTPLRTVTADELRPMPIPRQRRVVGKDGVRFDSRAFIAPELNAFVRKAVEFQYIPYDYREVDVFVDGRYLATAKPHEHLTEEERAATVEQRNKDARRVNELMRERSRRAKARFALQPPSTKPEREVPSNSSRRRRAERQAERPQRKPARKPSRDLLDLGAPNKPIDPDADREEEG